MEHFKIAHFERESVNTAFPKFYKLEPYELTILQNALFNKFNVKSHSLLELTKIIQSTSIVISHTCANDENFSLLNLFSRINVIPNGSVYLNWYRYDNIDKIQLIDLNNYFNDIWYPIADDIDIFDDSFSWILSVRHDGILSLALL